MTSRKRHDVDVLTRAFDRLNIRLDSLQQQ